MTYDVDFESTSWLNFIPIILNEKVKPRNLNRTIGETPLAFKYTSRHKTPVRITLI